MKLEEMEESKTVNCSEIGSRMVAARSWKEEEIFYIIFFYNNSNYNDNNQTDRSPEMAHLYSVTTWLSGDSEYASIVFKVNEI